MYDVLRPWLFRLDPERAHALGFAAARLAQVGAPGRMRRHYVYEDAVLQQRVAGLDFGNPVGLAAGFDKNGQLLPFWETLGFGFVEVGSVTAHASRGNPRPRTFRLPEDQAIINRMGLPNQGAARISQRIKRVRKRCHIPIGISLAKTHNAAIVGPEAVADYCTSFVRLAPMADYVALNVSCPNTADGKTFEDPASLDTLLEAIFRERRGLYSQPPIFLKVSPPPSARVVFDSQIEEILAVGRAHGVRGYIATNTAADRDGLKTRPDAVALIGAGGVSGPPLRPRTMRLVRYLYRRLGPQTPIIGVGGVDSAQAAYRMLRAGATLVQFYTSLAYEGPSIVKRIKAGLAACCERDGLGSIREAIGADG